MALTLKKLNNVAPNDYNVRLKIQANSITKFINLKVSVRDFNLSYIPNSIQITQNSQYEFPIVIESLNQFSDEIILKIEDENGFPYSSYVSIEPNSITLDKVSTETFITLKTSDYISLGSHNLKLVAISQKYNLVKKYNLELNVIDPNQEINNPTFNISINPNNLTIEQGSSQSVNATITPDSGFTGVVNLQLQNIDGSLAPAGISISPTTIDVPDNQTVPFAMIISVDSSATPGTYNLRIRAFDTSNTIEKFVYITLNVTGGFDINLNPQDVTDFVIATGSSTTTHLVITPYSGFTGTIKFELQDATTGLTSNDITMTPTQILVDDINPISLLISINVSSSANTGIYNLRIAATSGNIKRYLYINVEVQ